jgi:hypothetical protein
MARVLVNTISTIKPENLLRITSFTSSGTWVVQSDVKTVIVEILGGGSGGARLSGQGRAAGGSAGGYSKGFFVRSQLPSTVSITIGAGGTYTPSSTSGGTTAFGSFMTATGGAASGNYVPGIPGIGSGGFLNSRGQYGDSGLDMTLGANPREGAGGHAGGLFLSQVAGSTGQFGSAAPSNSGAGGQGGWTTSSNDAFGGSGGSGFVIIYEYGY